MYVNDGIGSLGVVNICEEGSQKPSNTILKDLKHRSSAPLAINARYPTFLFFTTRTDVALWSFISRLVISLSLAPYIVLYGLVGDSDIQSHQRNFPNKI